MFRHRKFLVSILAVVLILGIYALAMNEVDPYVLKSAYATSNEITATNIILVPVTCGLGSAAAISLHRRRESLLAYPNKGRVRAVSGVIVRLTLIMIAAQMIALAVGIGIAANNGSGITVRTFAQVPLSLLHLLAFTMLGVGLGLFLPYLLTPPLLAAGLWSIDAFGLLNTDTYGYTLGPLTGIGTQILNGRGYAAYGLLFLVALFAGIFLILSELFEIRGLLWVSVALLPIFAVGGTILTTSELYETSAGETRCTSVGEKTELCVPKDQEYRTEDFAAAIAPFAERLEQLPSYPDSQVLTLDVNLSTETLLLPENTHEEDASSVVAAYSQCLAEWNRDTDPLPVSDAAAEAESDNRAAVTDWLLGKDGATTEQADQSLAALQQCPPGQP